MREAALQRKPLSMESRLKCAVNVRPFTITDLDGTNPSEATSGIRCSSQGCCSIIEAAKVIECNEKTIIAKARALSSNGILKRKYLVTDTIDT